MTIPKLSTRCRRKSHTAARPGLALTSQTVFSESCSSANTFVAPNARTRNDRARANRPAGGGSAAGGVGGVAPVGTVAERPAATGVVAGTVVAALGTPVTTAFGSCSMMSMALAPSDPTSCSNCRAMPRRAAAVSPSTAPRMGVTMTRSGASESTV